MSVRWLDGEIGYTTLEASSDPAGGRDIVRHDPKPTGKPRSSCRAEHLVPPGEARTAWPSTIMRSPPIDRGSSSSPTPSASGAPNTRGDYWVLDRASRELQKLGGDAPASSLMHAKLSPDGHAVAYVRDNNIYVEDLRDSRIIRLTSSNSTDVINGTFDWVYEEEFGLRDGFRWSPDGKSIAYWQLDTTGVREFPLVNNTDSLYPRINPVKYPKVGETNAAVPDRCRPGRRRRNVLDRSRRRPPQPLHRLHGMGRQFAKKSSSSNSTGTRTQSTSCWRMPAPARSATDSDRSRRRLDRSTGRVALDPRRPRVPLAQRTRRLAAHLPGRREPAASQSLITSRRLRRDRS